jgi:TetR/AcrR family transcriptional repressor of nem operon
MKLFHTRGFHATGVAEILDKSNVRSGSLYYFFESKEKLLDAVLDHYSELLEPAILEPLRAQVADPIERVFGMLHLYREHLLRTRFKSGCPIGNLALEVADANAVARRKIAANFEGWRQAVRGFLGDARDRLPRELDRDQLATHVLTTMEGGVMLARAYESIDPFDASVEVLRDYFRRIVSAESKPPTNSEGESS